MKARVQEIIQVGDKLFSARFPLLTLWQTFAENFNPLRADFTRVRYISEEFASYLMTGRPVLAHRELQNALSSILRPRGMKWFEAETGEEKVNEDQASKTWLESATNKMRKIMYDKRAQFTRATKEGDGDYILFGQCVIEPRLNDEQNGFLYRTWHLRDCVWAESANLVIDTFHRKWKPQARQLVKLFPKTVDPKVAKLAEKDPFQEINCRHVVMPMDEYDSIGLGKLDYQETKRSRKLPYVSVTIDEENQCVMEEVPQHELGYIVPRWVTIGGFSQYAYSPTAIVALPDGRMLQQMTLTLVEIGQKIVDPPMIAVGDVIQGGTNLYAGAINWVDPDYDERTGEALRPLTLDHSGLQWGTEYEEKIEKVINEAFFLNVLNLPQFDGKEMTAYEVSERMKEYIRRATPLFEPMDLEYNGLLCDYTFRVAMRQGAFGSPLDMPAALRGQEIQWKFANPLVSAEKEQKTQSFKNMAQLLAAAMQLDSTLIFDVDTDVAFRDAVPGTGAGAKWLRAVKDADKLKAEDRQKQQAIQQAQQLGQVADQGAKVGNAVKNVGDAASSLQDAGMSQ